MGIEHLRVKICDGGAVDAEAYQR